MRLVDPYVWQATLDRWIVSDTGSTHRTPIAFSPFGMIIYYRKLTETDEDIATLDSATGNSDVLSWSLVKFFTTFMADASEVESVIPTGMLETAERSAAPLGSGEAYFADPMLLSMRMLSITGMDALMLIFQRHSDVVSGRAELRDPIQCRGEPRQRDREADLPTCVVCCCRERERTSGSQR